MMLAQLSEDGNFEYHKQNAANLYWACDFLEISHIHETFTNKIL